MKWQIYFCLFVVYSLGIPVYSQNKPTSYVISDLTADEAEVFENAEFYFEEKKYIRALSMYSYVQQNHPDDEYLKYMSGRCCIGIDYERKNALTYLLGLEKSKNDIIKKDILLYIAKAYHITNQFQKAKEYYYKYLEAEKFSGIEIKPEDEVLVKLYINQCANGEEIINENTALEVKNIGSEINTSAAEYVPLINSDGSLIIYTYRGERSKGGLMDDKFRSDPDGIYYEDIFISNNVGGHWLSPTGIADNINTKGHDASIALSADAQTLFLYKSTAKDNGDIYVCKLNGDQWTKPIRLGKNINTIFWEGSCSISADEQTLFFSSERPGGLGGKDIWYAKWENGDWGVPKNIGPLINTPFNDDAPFIHPDNVTLFFSSEGHTSIGGHDIMFSKFENGEWSVPLNMGVPVNTAGDERYYVLSADGEFGLFSSDREGGFGQQDLYTVIPVFKSDPPVLALLLGTVTMDDKPIGATINIKNETTGIEGRQHKANSLTGKYLLALTPGNDYKIAIEVEGGKSAIQYLDIKALDTYVKVDQPIPFYSEEYKKANGITDENTAISFQNNLDKQLKKIKEENTTEYYEAAQYKEILKKYGDEQKEGVSYTVELGTYENADDFDASVYSSLGEINKRKDVNGNTIYSVNTFKTLLEAEIFKHKVLAIDSTQKDNVVVTVNDNGERKIIQQYKSVAYRKKNYEPILPKVIKSQSLVSLDDNKEYTNLVKTNGNLKMDGLLFKLEAGTFADTNEFNKMGLEKYGKIDKKVLPNGLTRYTIGEFKSLAEADAFRKKVAAENESVAKSFVTVFYFEEKKSVKEFFESEAVALANQKKTNNKTNQQETTALVNKNHKEENKPVKQSKENEITNTTEEKNVTAKKEDNRVEAPLVAEVICDTNAPNDFSFYVGKDLNDPVVYNKLINEAGTMCVTGLIYTVQIGAYRFPQNYKYKNLKMLGNADVRDYPDGITRFTMKEFKTLKEAEVFRQQVIKKGTADAWITAWYNGKRMLLTELIPVNFYNSGVN